MVYERYGEGWQARHKAALAASRNPIPPYKGGGGFMHVPGQIGMYSEYVERGGPAEGVGTGRILAGGRMAGYRSGVRMAGSPLQAPITYTSIRGGPPVFVPTESTRSYGGASTGLAAGGSALARGGPSVGTVPGGGLSVMPAVSAGGGLSAAPAGGLGGLGGSITSAGTGIMSMVTQYLPLAIKVILAVIVIKIVLWMVRGKK